MKDIDHSRESGPTAIVEVNVVLPTIAVLSPVPVLSPATPQTHAGIDRARAGNDDVARLCCDRRTIICMLLIVALLIIWQVFGAAWG